MKTSEAFKLAKKKLWDGRDIVPRNHHAAVCSAAKSASVDSIIAPIVKGLIAPYSSLGMWLKDVHGIDALVDWKKYQQTRHAWVDHLIQHYESLGD